jgi:DNA-directed RNA polymerase specialized sigma24 family protein
MIDDLAVTDRTISGSGDAERATAFARLVDRDLGHAYRLASLLLGNELEAQEAVHDAAAVAWDRFADLRERTRFEDWTTLSLTGAGASAVTGNGAGTPFLLRDGILFTGASSTWIGVAVGP